MLRILIIIGIILQVMTSTIDQLLLVVAPVVTWLAVYIVNWIKAKLGTEGFNGTVVITIIVPAMSLLGAWIATLIVPGTSFFLAFLIGFGGVFINQFIKQWGQQAKGIQTPVEPTLTTLKKRL